MANVSVNQFKKDLEVRARYAEGYDRNKRDSKQITLWADKYNEAIRDNDSLAKDIYSSALMLKFWDQIGKMYEKTKTAGMYDYEDYTAVLFKCITIGCEYWGKKTLEERTSTNAMACINQTIASRGVAEIMYNANRDTYKANVNSASLDSVLSEDDSSVLTLGDTLAAEEEDFAKGSVAEQIVQDYINHNKIVEAIILDCIAFRDCLKESKRVNEYVNEEGETKKYTVKYNEFTRFGLVKELNAILPEYQEYFVKKYVVDESIFKIALDRVKSSPNTRLYKYLDKTISDLRSNKAILEMLVG